MTLHSVACEVSPKKKANCLVALHISQAVSSCLVFLGQSQSQGEICLIDSSQQKHSFSVTCQSLQVAFTSTFIYYSDFLAF